MKELRNAVRALIVEKGYHNIINADVARIAKMTGTDIHAVMNTLHYFEFSKQQAKFRAEYGF